MAAYEGPTPGTLGAVGVAGPIGAGDGAVRSAPLVGAGTGREGLGVGEGWPAGE